MQRVRITINHNPQDPTDDLRLAARLRRNLWAHSPLEIDPDGSAHRTRRDADGNAYFEFATGRWAELERVLEQDGYAERARVDIVAEGAGTECVNCGNISQELVAVCPACSFRDIEPCPYCNNDIPRLAYVPVFGDMFECPMCHHRVRMRFNDSAFDSSDQHPQPLVLVSAAEAPVNHGV